MSNRLTFSLASLVLILALGLVFAPTSVMAATGGPTVTITEYTGKNAATPAVDHVQTRTDFRLKVEFSHLVTGFAADDVNVQTAASTTSLLTDITTSASVTVLGTSGATGVPATELTDNKVFVIGLTLNDDNYAAGYLAVRIAEDLAIGAEAAVNNIGNQPGSFGTSDLPKQNDWTFTATLGTDAPEIADGKFTVPAAGANPNTFTVLLTSSNGTGNTPTHSDMTQIQVKDKDGRDVTLTTLGSQTVNTIGLVTTVTFSIPAATDPVAAAPIYVGVNPQWANAVPAGGLRIPAETSTTPKRDEVGPVVDISLVSHDAAMQTIRARFTFEKATVDTATQTALNLPTLTAADISIMKTDPADPMMMVPAGVALPTVTELNVPGQWLVEVDYSLDDSLPLYVGLKDSDKVSAITIDGMAPGMGEPMALMVGMAESTAMAPDVPTGVTATADQATDMITISWAKPNANGADITGYTITQTGQAAMTYTAAADATSHTTGALAAGAYSFTVIATNRVGNSPASAAAMATINADTAGNGDGNGAGATGDVMIASKGYAVLVNPGATSTQTGIHSSVSTIEYDLPNLYEFFRDSGTIVLNGPAGTAARAVTISEIMWGQDAHLTDPTMSQWIEIHNPGTAAITVNFGSSGSWSLTFKRAEYDPNPAGAVDHLSNLGNPGFWQVVDTGENGTYGQSGRSESTATENQEELVSMVRASDLNKSHRSDGWEKAIRPSVNIAGARVANPGSAKRVIAGQAKATVDRSTVFISEIGNLADGSDWIELYNSSDSAVNIKNWIISTVTAADVAGATPAQLTAGNTEGGGIDKEVVQFARATYEDALKIPAKSYLLVTAEDPANNDLAVGINLLNTKVDRDPKENETTGQTHLYYVASGLKIPDEASLVILRNHHEREGRSANFRDVVNIGEYVASTDVNVFIVGTNNNNSWNTEVWPLEATRKPGDRENLGTGNNRIIERNIGKTNHWAHKDLWAPAPFTGLGYDRNISESATTKGTPGYANGGGLEKIADLKDGDITISEIMYASGGGRVPQWIELYNSSMTRTVSLNGWDLEINNVDSEDIMSNEYINRRITLGNFKVLPNQTVLIVSTSGRNTGRDIFPSHRTIDLSSPDAFGRDNRLDPILSSTGFNIALYDKDDKFVDEVGNIDNNRRTNDEPAWDLPEVETEDGRTSIIRRYDGGEARTMEDMEGAWIRASDTNLAYLNVGDLYYGRSTDISTPGFRGGGPLPVSLSKFRPERLDSGEIVVRWITESELNNAGFNILRSDTRDGEFTKLNTQLIAGQGTTSEKTAYTFTDTSAKPNVVYYYQIQDVSLDGQVTTLRTTHLRGNVTAAGKLTTIWGELKALQ